MTLIFLLGLLIRYISIYPANTIIGFDQARDLFDALKIISGDIRIVGPTAGNNANLHHGVAFLYYIIPAVFLGGNNPIYVVLFNALVNSLTAIVVYHFCQSLFENKKASLISAFVVAVSYYFVQFSGWISNPTVTLFTVPFFFWGLWRYKKGGKKGLVLSFFALGISIQFEIFFLYLIPIFLISWLLLKPKFPDLKTIFLSIFAFLLATSTMLLTEIKFKFSGVKALLLSPDIEKPPLNLLFGEFFERFWQTFSLNLIPQKTNWGIFLGVGIITFSIYWVLKKEKKEKLAISFLLVYLFSPLTMLLVGYHRAPWFLIGLPPAITILTGYFLSKLNNWFVIPILVYILISNLGSIKESQGKGQILLEPDRASILSTQLEAIEYTYQIAKGKPFAINTVTNPLYINAVWAYHYSWYGERYSYLPSWLGGNQIYPYDTLEKSTGQEEIFFLIIDQTFRIPDTYKLEAIEWAKEKGKLVEEKNFDGLTVYLFEN